MSERINIAELEHDVAACGTCSTCAILAPLLRLARAAKEREDTSTTLDKALVVSRGNLVREAREQALAARLAIFEAFAAFDFDTE